LKSWNSRGRLGEVALRERRLESKRGERRNEGEGESGNILDVNTE